MEKFLELLPGIVIAIGAAIALAAAVAKLTKSKKDDEVVAKIDEAFDVVEDLVSGRGDEEK